MKKLILLICLILFSCGGSYQKPETSDAEADSLWIMLNTADSIDKLMPSYQDDVLKSISMQEAPETLSVQKDTIIPKKSLPLEIKLDTTSNLPQIKKNMEVIDYQQKQLDTLLMKKKR